jgi:hypothetical protein
MLQKMKVLRRNPHEARKLLLLKSKDLTNKWRPLGLKKGAPRNEGISVDIHENKGQKNIDLGASVDVIETN